MRRAIPWLFCLTALLATTIPMRHALATFVTGEPLNHMLSVCVFKDDAVAIIKADAEKGKEAATEVWNAKEACLSVPVQGHFVGKVVFSAEVSRDRKTFTAKVVEILDPSGKVVAYFLTSQDVNEPIKGANGAPIFLKPDRHV